MFSASFEFPHMGSILDAVAYEGKRELLFLSQETGQGLASASTYLDLMFHFVASPTLCEFHWGTWFLLALSQAAIVE